MKGSERIKAILAVAALAAWSGGCGSEAVAPHTDLPPLSTDDLVRQAAVLAVGIYASADEVLAHDPIATKDAYEVDIGNTILVGVATVEVLCGEDGHPCAETDPAASRLHATGKAVADLPLGGLELSLSFEYDVDPFDPVTECGLVRGAGTLIAGVYTSRFRLEEISACGGAYPSGGRVVLEAVPRATDGAVPPADLPSVTVEFDGTQYPLLVAGDRRLRADLDDPLALH